MELLKNIFFNTDKLVEGTTVKLSYTGYLYSDSTSNVYLHYGYNNEWNELTEIQMEKTDLGYQAEYTLLPYQTLNLCFRDDNNNWDNNENSNYVFNISPAETALTICNEVSVDTKRPLRKTYLWSKKIRLAIYKILVYVPKLISGNYKRKISEE